MPLSFIHSFESEWIKKKRSLASWIVVIGGFFTPAIIIVARLIQHTKLGAIYSSENFWQSLWHSSWESMAIFLLPLGVILSTSLITQLEYKNNTWKQLHTLPVTFTTIFFAKLSVVIIMMLQFFIFFNIGIYLAAVVPYLLVGGVPYPKSPMPYVYFLQENALFFIDCLPIIALQYLISLQYKNFLVPVGVGFMLWVGSVASLSWRLGYTIPYTYCSFNYLKDSAPAKVAMPPVNIHYMAVGYFVVFTIVGYVLYLNKKEKG